jgi:hypothetical protein
VHQSQFSLKIHDRIIDFQGCMPRCYLGSVNKLVHPPLLSDLAIAPSIKTACVISETLAMGEKMWGSGIGS